MTEETIKKPDSRMNTSLFQAGQVVRAMQTIRIDDLQIDAGDQGIVRYMVDHIAQVRWEKIGQILEVPADSICLEKDYVPATERSIRFETQIKKLTRQVADLGHQLRHENRLLEQAEINIEQLEKQNLVLIQANVELGERNAELESGLTEEEDRATEMCNLLAEQAMVMAGDNSRIEQHFLTVNVYEMSDGIRLQERLNDGWQDVHCKTLDDQMLVYDLRREVDYKPATDDANIDLLPVESTLEELT